MGIFQKGNIVVRAKPFLVLIFAPDNDLQCYTTHACEGQYGVWYLTHTSPHLAHLLDALGTRDIKHQQPSESDRLAEAGLAEGGREDEVWQTFCVLQQIAGSALLLNQARVEGDGGDAVCSLLGFL